MSTAQSGVSRASFLSGTRAFLLTLLGVPTIANAATSAADNLRHGSAGFKGKTLDQKVQELADREEIRELAARYAQRVAHRESPADLFTDDGAFIVRLPDAPMRETRGRAELDKTYAAIAARPDPSLPAIHNHIISVAGDEATGLCWIEVHVRGQQTTGGSGYYEDRYRRENGRWKFAARDSTMVEWRQGVPADPSMFSK